MSTPPSTPNEPAIGDKTIRQIVLIVEDEAPIAEALSYFVEDAGYMAIVAADGKAGLELALRHRPALIITDLMMPQMGGLEFIHLLLGELGQGAPPIVLMTAADTRFAKDAGADIILKKPFDLTKVEALLSRFLDAD